jgi:hypothetical protein
MHDLEPPCLLSERSGYRRGYLPYVMRPCRGVHDVIEFLEPQGPLTQNRVIHYWMRRAELEPGQMHWVSESTPAEPSGKLALLEMGPNNGLILEEGDEVLRGVGHKNT